jgi:NAD(P)-dependent dehydrogenase (short-subunit alcohol dehydrogenase family)
MPNVLVVGGTRGLGAALVAHYSSQPLTRAYATSRKDAPREPQDVKWLTGIDLTKPDCGEKIAAQLGDVVLSLVYVTAGIFKLESFEEPKWDVEVTTYLTSAVAPPFILSALFKGGHLAKKADPPCKIILLSSEAGSLKLNQAGGGGNYAHHASKSAVNMVGTQLRYDLEPHGIAIGMVHPSFMRTEMTKDVGFDVAYEQNDALTPEQAAEIIASWTDQDFDLSKTGQFWAPRGSRDIGSWNDVMGEHVKGPVQLPW